MKPLLAQISADACRTLQSLAAQEAAFQQAAAAIGNALRAGGKILTAGNGGSAADALHLAEELVGRYKKNRSPLPAVCLNADATALTCIANDFGFDEVFARQVEALAGQNDVLVCFSTSGNSPNIVRALEAARRAGARTIALLGRDGGKAKGKAEVELIVAAADTARIQEAHTLLLHALLEAVEPGFAGV